jgi:hypothetical protein
MINRTMVDGAAALLAESMLLNKRAHLVSL